MCPSNAHHSSPEHLQHLLLNLAVFCVRAADGQPVRVSARCVAAAAAEGAAMHGCKATLVLHVTASGLVLSAAQLATAFDPYAQDSGADADHRVRAACICAMCPSQHGTADASWPRVCVAQAGPSQSRLGLHVSRRLAEGALAAARLFPCARVCA
jgi:hypothetical protein